MRERFQKHGLFLAVLLAVALVSSACSKKPEVELAHHLDAVADILEAKEDDPIAAFDELDKYLRKNLPEIARLYGELAVELDELEDKGERKDRLEEMLTALEAPAKRLNKAGMALGQKNDKQLEILGKVMEIAARWEVVGDAFKEEFGGGGLGMMM